MKNYSKIFLVFFLSIFINCKGYNKLLSADKAEVIRRSIKLNSIEAGSYSGYSGKEMLLEVIKEKNKFNDFYKTIHSIDIPFPNPPEIDFSKSFVLAAFLGEKPSGGYSIEFGNAYLEEDTKLYVEVLIKKPPKNIIFSQAITSPYTLASADKAGIEEIVFLGQNGEAIKRVKFH